MKNILIISSSPRKKGNSQILCEQFKKGAEAKGHQVKIVRIMEQNIGFCRACDGCMRNGGTCVLKDDMAEILKMFQKADVLVLATPVYFYGISGQMKTFIDRTYPIWQHLGKKEVAVYLVANDNAIPFYEKLGMRKAEDVMEYNHIEWTPFTVK